MNDFRSAYQSAVQDVSISGMKELHIDVSDCMDEARHRRRVVKRVRRISTMAFSLMGIIFVCGFGTVQAAEYIQNVIMVRQWGFASGDAATMAEEGKAGSKAYLLDEEVESVLMAEEQGLQSKEAQAGPYAGLSGSGEEKIEEIPVQTYNSLKEFEKNETIIFPQPSISIGDNISSTNITVCGNWAMIRYDVDGKVLWLERTDYTGTGGHASSKMFPGGVENERTYTTTQGYTYRLVDSVRQSGDEQLQIHAAATVGGYEVFCDFMGFEEAEAERIMDSIDLSVYE